MSKKVKVALTIKKTAKGYTIVNPTKAISRKLDSILEKTGDTTIAHVIMSKEET